MAKIKETVADFRVILKGGLHLVAEQQDARSDFSSPKMSVRKTLLAVRSAADRAGLEWPDSAPSSAKKLKTESEPEVEKIPSEHRLSLNCGSQESRVY